MIAVPRDLVQLVVTHPVLFGSALGLWLAVGLGWRWLARRSVNH